MLVKSCLVREIRNFDAFFRNVDDMKVVGNLWSPVVKGLNVPKKY